MTDDPHDPHRLAKQAMETPGPQLESLMPTLDEAEAILAALATYQATLPPDSTEARMVARRLLIVRLYKNVKFCVIKVEPMPSPDAERK